MSTDPGIWGWTRDIGQLGFTVTFSLSRSPEEMLSHYGADAGRAQHLTREQAWARYPPNYGGAQLRVGSLGRWAFCFEEAGVEGMKPRTLSGLSKDTEAISFFMAADTSNFIFLKDGQGIEAFEPGRPETLLGEPPCKFWTESQKIMERATKTTPMEPNHAVLQAIAKHTRGLLDRDTLEGPLLTVLLADADRAPTNAYFDDSPVPPPPRTAPRPASAYRGSAGAMSPATMETGPRPVIRQPLGAPEPRFGRGLGQARAS